MSDIVTVVVVGGEQHGQVMQVERHDPARRQRVHALAWAPPGSGDTRMYGVLVDPDSPILERIEQARDALGVAWARGDLPEDG